MQTETNRKFHVSEIAVNERDSYGGAHNERGLYQNTDLLAW